MKKGVLFIFILLSINISFGQERMDVILNTLQPVDTLPSNLLKTKSIVFLNIPVDSENWGAATRLIHSYLRKPGIDPVAYYCITDVYAGIDVTRSFTLDFMKREVENIILVDYENENSTVAVFPADYETYLSMENQLAWKKTGPIKEILNRLYVKAANSRLDKQNLLIIDRPEKGILTDPVGGNRATFFSIDLKESKLAIPIHRDLDTIAMREIMEKYYPHDFGFVDKNIPEPELTRMGYRYILRHISASGKKLKEFMKYPVEKDITAYPTMRRRDGKEEIIPIRAEEFVYKFYIKHLRAGRMFLGTEWDVDIRWEDALINHVNSYKNELGIDF